MYRLYVVRADGDTGRATLGGSPPEPPLASSGADVHVTYWRGQIRYVDFGSGREYTRADPRDDYKLLAACGLAIGLYGTDFLWCGYWRTRHARTARRMRAWQIALPFVASGCLALLGGFAPWVTDDMGAALRLVGQGTAAVAAGCLPVALFLRRRPPGDDTVTVRPSVPVGERRFPGQILGEVPHAGQGTHLLAADGRLMTTPGHAGAAFRRAVPPTLTPLRVRHPYWTDPSPGRTKAGHGSWSARTAAYRSGWSPTGSTCRGSWGRWHRARGTRRRTGTGPPPAGPATRPGEGAVIRVRRGKGGSISPHREGAEDD
ncbi:hypothetical protein [Streptomyces sp. 8P21H-1]|uniref:hypothetical protein n=1 Tax=Streptomyces sp. 8P21H-1 TaxID=2737048 RepID=UPI00156F653A|nr:hypothetical protein [Streptomyces sp. 8P21H-1]NSL43718.1 hypothetical protein [Streptomyces sp. 8P21H-1]